MKKIFTVLLLLALLTSVSFGQLSTGDIAFTAFNADGNDDFAIVALTDIPANSIIYFSDNEPNADGTGFNDFNEGTLQWETGSSTISAGTVVVFTDTDDGSNPSFGASVGNLAVASFDSGMNLGAAGDALYAVVGSPDGNNITAWLAGIQNEANNQGANFAQTGLTVGTTFINYYSSGSPDGGYYSGARSGEASFPDYLPLLGNNSNWTEEVSNGENILPISTTAFTVTGGVANPTDFSASPSSPSQMDISWTKNTNNDNVLLAYNTTDSFGTPTDGTTYTAGDLIGSATVLYNGATPGYTHTGLDENTTYYYRAWSVDGSTNYSSGVSTNALTLKSEPSAYPTNFTATASSASQIDLSWTDAAAGSGKDNEPDGYLIRANTTGTFTDPVDGTEEPDNTDSNGGTVNVSQGVGAYNWTGLNAGTQYYFKIWSYTNTGSHIDYLTSGTPPTANETTDAAPSLPNAWINEFHYDDAGVDANEFVEIIIETSSSYTLSDFQVDLYNGNGGSSYNQVTLDNYTVGTTYNEGGSVFTLYSYNYTADGGIQNGAPDGLALSYQGNLIQFLSYEGTFTATGGPASGTTSTDIGVSESSAAENSSLGLEGDGTQYSDFTWTTFSGSATPGTKNGGQALPVELTSFYASQTEGAVILNWETATEVDNYGFEVQRASSRLVGTTPRQGDWETIGFVQGYGNSNSPKSYSFVDDEAISGTVKYRLKQIDTDGAFEYSPVVEVVVGTPEKFKLEQNYPNPFSKGSGGNPSTVINYSIPEESFVELSVFNILGQQVAKLVNEKKEAGTYNVQFDAGNLQSGIYFYRIVTEKFSAVKKMMLVK